jgi:hypothetical protein
MEQAMSDGTYALFRRAIQNRLQVTCDFNGYHREVCPHALGSKHERQQVLAFQFGGGSSRKLLPAGEWRSMVLENICNIQLRHGPWHTGDDLARQLSCFDHIDVELKS